MKGTITWRNIAVSLEDRVLYFPDLNCKNSNAAAVGGELVTKASISTMANFLVIEDCIKITDVQSSVVSDMTDGPVPPNRQKTEIAVRDRSGKTLQS